MRADSSPFSLPQPYDPEAEYHRLPTRINTGQRFGADTPLNQYSDRFGTYPYEVCLLPRKRHYLAKYIVRPRLRQYLAKRSDSATYVVMEKGERRVSWTELFYDLVFVGVISHLTHGLANEHDLAILFAQYILMFLAIYRVFYDSIFYMNCLDAEDLVHKLFLLVMMIGLLSLASNSEAVFANNSIAGFAISYVVVRILQASMYIWAGIWIPRDVRGNITAIVLFRIALCVPWIAACYVSMNASYVIVGGAIAAEYLVPAPLILVLVRKFNFSPIISNNDHLVERHGLFIMIVLGETILNAAFPEDGSYNWQNYFVAICGVLIAGGMQWIYYDIASLNYKMHALVKSQTRASMWLWCHVFFAVSLSVMAGGFKRLFHDMRVGDPPTLYQQIVSVWMFGGGFMLALSFVSGFRHLHKVRINPANSRCQNITTSVSRVISYLAWTVSATCGLRTVKLVSGSTDGAPSHALVIATATASLIILIGLEVFLGNALHIHFEEKDED